MTLTLDLSEELESRLRTVARAQGTDEAEAARKLLDSALPPAVEPITFKKIGKRIGAERGSARGEFAHIATSSDDFSRRKQEEIQQEEAAW